MKIKYLIPEAIENLKETLISSHKSHLHDETPDYFIKFFNTKGWLRESKYEVPDIDFDLNHNFDVADPLNIRNVYESMKDIPPAVAAEECIWAGLAFTDMWSYVHCRREKELASNDSRDILNSFFYMRGGKRSTYMHCLARLWWTGYLLYDESNKQNPYELSDYFASRAFASRIVLLSSVNILENPESAKGFVQCQYDRKKEGKNDGRYQFTELGKYFNNLGGITIIDSLSRQEVYDKSIAFMNEHFKK